MFNQNSIINKNELILVTGASGFIGSRVTKLLLDYGYSNIRCLVRPSSDLSRLNDIIESNPQAKVDVVRGNLLSQNDCNELVNGVRIIYHLAAGRGVKSFADAVLNSVVTTKNLLSAVAKFNTIRRFVNVSSFTVYSNWKLKRGDLLDETCELETNSDARGEAYCFAKVKQEAITVALCKEHGIPYVIVRPGVVYGPGNRGLHGRVGIGTFGLFLHLGGKNRIPLTYVDNCADAIVLAGITEGVDGEAFNVVDDGLPKSRTFLKMYKNNVSSFKSLYVPYRIFYLFCYLWEKYSDWSQEQLPPTFNRKMCSNYWKGNRYSNAKLKDLLGWQPRVCFEDAAKNYFEFQRITGGRK